MSTNIGQAELEVIPSARDFGKKLDSQVGGQMSSSGRKAGQAYSSGFSGGIKKLAGAAVGLVAVSQVTGFLKDANAEARESQKVGALTTQVIRSTGGAANVTADQVGNLATAISNKVGVDDEAIQSGSNLLLTFKNVRNEAGKGNQIFDRATRSAVNLSAAGFGSITGASKQLGKALNDPVKGIAALSRAGVTFTDEQKNSIKYLVEHNRELEAQKIILGEVESQVGGAATAQATAGDKARVSFDNLKETIGTALLPVVDKLSTFVSEDLAPGVTKFVTGMQDGTGAGGEFADVLKDTYEVGKNVVEFIDDIPGPVKKFAVQGLIAAAVLSKVNAGLTLVGRSGVGTFVTGMARAETRMTTTRKAAFRLGGALRQAGGIGGAVALASGLQDLNKEASGTDVLLGGLKTTAGAAATGFAVGGPLGAGIGLVGGGLYSLVEGLGLFGTAVKKNDGPLKISKQTLEDYAVTLDDVSGAATGATRSLVLQRLEQSGLLSATRKLGLSDREAVNAMTGNKAAREKLSHALRNTTKLTNDQKEALRLETGVVAQSRLKQLKHNIAIANSATELKKAKEALRKFMKEPANKHVSITGAEDVVGKLNSIRTALYQVFGKAEDLNVTPGDLGDLLHVPRGATGGIVRRPTLALIGESGPEAVVPLNRTPGSSPLPAASGSGGGSDRFVLVLDDGTALGGYIDRRADSRVGASSGMGAMSRRAGGR